MTWDPSTGQFFWQCRFNLCCCIGTGGAGISWLLLPFPQFITSLWLLLEGQTSVPSNSTLWGPDFTVLASEVLPLHQDRTWGFLIPPWSTRMLICFKTKWLFQGDGEETKSCIVTFCLLSCQVSVSKTWTIFLVTKVAEGRARILYLPVAFWEDVLNILSAW